MVIISRRLSFVIFFVAGFTFIGIGIVSIVDSYIPRFVEITEKIDPNQTEVFTPDMNAGNIANIYINGSGSRVSVMDPNNNLILNETDVNGIFNETITSEIDGKYRIQIVNDGSNLLNLNLGAYSKASPIAFSGQMMLIITGVVILGLGIRTRMQSD